MFKVKNNSDIPKLVILDRDGVINHVPVPPNRYIMNKSELVLCQGFKSFVANLTPSNSKLVVATNQQGVGKAMITADDLAGIHSQINLELSLLNLKNISKFYVCDHLEDDNCLCRKPKPGMILNAIEEFGFSKSEAIFIGDKETDREAGLAAGIRFIKVKCSCHDQKFEQNDAIDIALLNLRRIGDTNE